MNKLLQEIDDACKYKTVMCRHYLQGHCTFGNSCTYAHGEKELRQLDSDGSDNDDDNSSDYSETTDEEGSDYGSSERSLNCGVCGSTHPRGECPEICFVTKTKAGKLSMYVRKRPTRPANFIHFTVVSAPVFSSALIRELARETRSVGGSTRDFFQTMTKREKDAYAVAEKANLQKQKQQMKEQRRQKVQKQATAQQQQQSQQQEAKKEGKTKAKAKAKARAKEPSLPQAGNTNPFYCPLCDCASTDMKGLVAHMNGKRHQAELQKRCEKKPNRQRQQQKQQGIIPKPAPKSSPAVSKPQPVAKPSPLSSSSNFPAPPVISGRGYSSTGNAATIQIATQGSFSPLCLPCGICGAFHPPHQCPLVCFTTVDSDCKVRFHIRERSLPNPHLRCTIVAAPALTLQEFQAGLDTIRKIGGNVFEFFENSMKLELEKATRSVVGPATTPAAVPSSMKDSGPKAKSCKHFNSPSGCRHGSNCKFAHVVVPGSSGTKVTPTNPSMSSNSAKRAAGGNSAAVPGYFCCPITLEIMEDPVIVTTSGESFERRAIVSWVTTHKTDPITRVPITLQNLVPNRKLKEAIAKWKASS